MSETTFDTLRYAKRLKEAGFTEQQAEVQTEALREIIEDKLATKADIVMLKRDIKTLEYKLTIRLGSMIVAGVAFLSAFMVILKVF